MNTNNIISLAYRLGKSVRTSDVEKGLGLDEGFIKAKTGIETLHYFENSEDFLQNCIEAISDACSKAGIRTSEIGGVYAVGNMTDYVCPTLSTQLVQRLGLQNVVSDSVGLGCCGGIQALKSANNQLVVDSLEGKTAFYVVVAADHISKMTNQKDYRTKVLFSDGVAAMIVTNHDRPGLTIESIKTRTLAGSDLFALQVKSSAHPAYEGNFWEMEGRKVFGFGVEAFGLSTNLLGVQPEDVDFLIPHQANLRMLESMQEQYSIPSDKLYKDSVIAHGNTSSSSVFIGLADLLEEKEFDKVALIAFGAELSYGGAILSRREN